MLKKINTYFWRLSTILGNLRLSIILLLVLSLLSSLGTVIEQDKLVSFYELNYPNSKPLFGFINSNVILFLGLNRVYTSWWFDFTVLLFGLSLISCTFTRQLPSLKMARLWQFYNKTLNLNKFKSPQVGLEPTTNRLTVDRSTTELLRIVKTSNFSISCII